MNDPIPQIDDSITLYANLYETKGVGGIVGYLYRSKKDADEAASGHRTTCLGIRVKRSHLPTGFAA